MEGLSFTVSIRESIFVKDISERGCFTLLILLPGISLIIVGGLVSFYSCCSIQGRHDACPPLHTLSACLYFSTENQCGYKAFFQFVKPYGYR